MSDFKWFGSNKWFPGAVCYQHCQQLEFKGGFTGCSDTSSGISCADCRWMVPQCHSVLPPPQSPQSCLPLQHWEYGAPPKHTEVSLTGCRQVIGQLCHICVNAGTSKKKHAKLRHFLPSAGSWTCAPTEQLHSEAFCRGFHWAAEFCRAIAWALWCSFISPLSATVTWNKCRSNDTEAKISTTVFCYNKILPSVGFCPSLSPSVVCAGLSSLCFHSPDFGFASSLPVSLLPLSQTHAKS